MTKEWHGSLNLIYGKQNNTTQILASKNQAPLKIQRPLTGVNFSSQHFA
ncbi:MAG: hypothetical protein F6K25_16090 [Okeania sp. SIO2G4]|nr:MULTISPECIES: hypothetical protein [unclassified Okeania]NEP06995.1 hypothetical protein [Okeania sp. SIO4D6]NEP73464.1 hypothetical protein [Okeania sp. SIO2G5]NEP94182.1 hypothetical protein [Okeania sp. SIO2F5]NEQ92136.1 hypothetical protein [Okeania sp. SIO2G4]